MRNIKRIVSSMNFYLGIFSAAAPGFYNMDGRSFRSDEAAVDLTGTSGLREMLTRLITSGKTTDKDFGGQKIDPDALKKQGLYYRVPLQKMLQSGWFVVRPSARGTEIFTETPANEQTVKKAQELAKDLSGQISIKVGEKHFEGTVQEFQKNGFADQQYMMEGASLSKVCASMADYLK